MNATSRCCHRSLNTLVALVALAFASASSATEKGACSPGNDPPATIQAVRLQAYGGPGQLKVESIPRPSAGANEVLVKVHAASVNPIDWKLREGHAQSWWPLKLPAILGRDAAGVVMAIGPGVKDFRCGDEVVVLVERSPQGTYAEYIAANIEDIALKPRSMSFLEGAAYPLVAISAWNGLIEGAKLKKGERVLIHGGAGGVGSMAVQIAKARGAHVIATASASNHEFLRSIGADEVVDYKTTRFEDVVHNVDVVFDTVGGETLQRSPKVLRPDGRLFSIAGSITAETCTAARIQCPDEASISIRAAFVELGKLIDAGKLHVHIDKILPLAQAAEAQELNRAGHTRGKIVLRMPPDRG